MAEIIRHPKFNASLSAMRGADITLLRMEAPVTLSRLVSPVTLAPESLVLIPGKKCWGAGWGTFEVYKEEDVGGAHGDHMADGFRSGRVGGRAWVTDAPQDYGPPAPSWAL